MARGRTAAATAAAAAPPPPPRLSALAARKARQEAQAQAQTIRSSNTRRPSQASSSRQVDSQSDEEKLGVEVVLPMSSASQAAASRARSPLPASSPDITAPLTLKRPRTSSTAQEASTSIAVTRPRRNSTASTAAQQVSTPKAPRASKVKVSQSTPIRANDITTPSSSKRTPASSNNVGKARHDSDAEGEVDADDVDNDLDLTRDLEKIISDLNDRNDVSDIQTSEQDAPPRKKRAKQPSNVIDTPLKSTSNTKRTPAKASRSEKAPSKKAAAKRQSPKKVDARDPKVTQSNEVASSAKAKQPPKKKLTADQMRVRDAKRYFADTAQQRGKTNVETSAMPVEDQETGFLAFGDDADDGDDQSRSTDAEEEEHDDQGEEAEEEDEDRTDDSSDDDQPQKGQSIPTNGSMLSFRPANGGPRRADRQRKGNEVLPYSLPNKIVLEDEEEDAEDDEQEDMDPVQLGSHALTRQALSDAVPYSRFVPVLEGETKNLSVVENKRKRGKEALYFGLRAGETLVFLGIGHLEVLRGSVQMGGAIISSSAEGLSAADIYAPLSNALPVLKSVSASRYPGYTEAAAGASQNSGDSQVESSVQDIFDIAFDSIVRLTPLSSPITALGQVCPIGGLATLFSMPPSLELSSQVHQLSTIKVLLEPDIDDLLQKQRQRILLANGIFPTVGLSATYIPHKWQHALHRLSASAVSAAQHPQEEAVVALIRGNKKVGKSTLSRMSLERLLSMGKSIGGKVAYLELDLGQSDFGPPGMVALHLLSLTDTVQSGVLEETEADATERMDGESDEAPPESGGPAAALQSDQPRFRNCIKLGPGWCQPRVPVRAHFIGDVSPRDDPESYVAAAHDLIDFFRTHIQPGQPGEDGEPQRVPLVINTQGWIKGLGADLAARIEPLLRPTHIFDVIPRGSSDPVPPPTRGQPWLDSEGAILGSGPEIVTLESVSQLEYVQNAFGQQRYSDSNNQRAQANANQSSSTSRAVDDKHEAGDGDSTPPRYITEVGSKLAPAESRLLNIMSYLYATKLAPPGPGSATAQGTWDFSQPLVHRRPLVVDVRNGLKAGVRVLALGSSVPDSLKLMALNSSIVAIIVTDRNDALQALQDDAEARKHLDAGSTWKQAFDRAAQLAQLGRGLSTRCVGLGIVRSIDALSGQIHLVAPLDPAFLRQVESDTGAHIGLIKGALELPVWASLDFEAIKEARESRLDVPPATATATLPLSLDGGASSNGIHTAEEQPQEKLLAGIPRNQVPYLEWPYSTNALTSSSSRQKGRHAAAFNGNSSSNASSVPLTLGSEKRRVRRNLMRKSQFA
ncbi:hypothetical protein EX895_000306 [Sporisorium graminicola]|uniref:Polynucleotide 5'-hydroxyl-kinase GRC3 n=1 Tax=Sporisorium graminicola TaxID=280036 RepID=A0A4U7L350_9BASI|nr:hypothetical protein EX895_000306 [Sporisorium graminicola]TKY90308.1 hypothetical protein EX895_000306 [Sporisorium graminicola]